MVVVNEKIGAALAQMTEAVQSGNGEGQQCVAYVAFAVFLDDEPGLCSMARTISLRGAPVEAVTIALNAVVGELEAKLCDPENEVEPGVDA